MKVFGGLWLLASGGAHSLQEEAEGCQDEVEALPHGNQLHSVVWAFVLLLEPLPLVGSRLKEDLGAGATATAAAEAVRRRAAAAALG